MLWLTLGMLISWALAIVWWSAWIVQSARLALAKRTIARLKGDNFRGL